MAVDTLPAASAKPVRASRRRKLIRVLDLTVWMTAGIASVIIAALVVIYGVEFSRVMSPSMTPLMPVGSVAVTSHIPADQLKVGQVVILRTPGDNAPYIHRVVALQFAPEGLVIRTKGDANPSADPWTVTVTSQEVAVLVFVLPTERITDLAMRLQFIAMPLFLFGVIMTAFFGWNAMKSPRREDDDAETAEYPDNDFNL